MSIQLHELEHFQVEPKYGFADYIQGHDQLTLIRRNRRECAPLAIISAVFTLSMTAV
jgi:hypothetical protein